MVFAFSSYRTGREPKRVLKGVLGGLRAKCVVLFPLGSVVGSCRVLFPQPIFTVPVSLPLCAPDLLLWRFAFVCGRLSTFPRLQWRRWALIPLIVASFCVGWCLFPRVKCVVLRREGFWGVAGVTLSGYLT